MADCVECGKHIIGRPCRVKTVGGLCISCASWMNSNNTNKYESAKSNAAKRGLEFTITENEFKAVKRGYCIFHGIEGSPCRDIRYHYKKGVLPYTTIDRLDNRKGYVSGNVVSMCEYHNTIKGAVTPEMVNRLYILFKENGIL